MTNRQYDILKHAALIGIPLFTSAYIAVVKILHLGLNEEIPIWSIVCVALLGVVVVFSSKRYNKSDAAYDGFVVVEEDPGGVKRASLVIEGDPETFLQTKNAIVFRIKRED